jgi:capsule polysaccharide modification protein KpsS
MNGLVLAPHSSLNLWNELAIVMNSTNKEFNLDGFTYVRTNNDLKFRKIYYYDEKILQKETCEEKIMNINCIISRDRWLRNLEYNKAVTICFNIYSILEKILTEKNYNFLIGEVSCASNEIAFYLSKKYDIPFYNITASLYRNKYFIYKVVDIYGNKNFIQEKINNLTFLSESTNSESESEIICKLKNNKTFKSDAPILYFKNLIYNLIKWKNQIFIDQHNSPLINIRALVRIYFNSDKKFYKKLHSVRSNDYFLYYLHYEPDLSTYVWSNNYVDQLHLLKILSNNLPSGTKLVVKEHPLSKLIRPSSFYNEINKLSNVILIDSNNYSYGLILNSKGVITLTGSVGYEAWLLGKPVMVFGNVFYDNFKDVYVCRDFDTIYDTLKLFLTYNLIKEDIVIRNNIDKYISNVCTQDGTIFFYENNFHKISTEEKLNNMQIVFNFINKTIYEK